GREAGRWLAGAVGEGGRRAWVLLCALPLAAILVATLSRLGGGDDAYPGAVWGTLAALVLSLVGVALSAGPPPSAIREPAHPAAPAAALPPWPQALAARGIQLRPVASWPESGPARAVRGAAAGFAERLRRAGASQVAPELVEAIHGLLSPAAGSGADGLAHLVLAPDDCGEVEAVAGAAQLLDQRFHAATLVVTAAGAGALAERLRHWVGGAGPVAALDGTGELPGDALLWVSDAQALSDRLLGRLKD